MAICSSKISRTVSGTTALPVRRKKRADLRQGVGGESERDEEG